jgi:pilus assembly protein CpaB
MRPKSLALLLLALGCGLVASIGITRVMQKGGENQIVAGESKGIFVAAVDVGMGDLLTPAMLKVEEWPKDKTPEGAITQLSDVEGRRARTRLYQGEPVLENRLFAKGMSQTGVSMMITKGYRIVPIKVDLVSGGSSLILPGDHVDMMVHFVRDPNRGIKETVTRTILQNVKVFAVDNIVDMDKDKQDGKSINAKTISLLLTPKQASLAMLATQMGTVNLVLRGPESEEQTASIETRTGELFGELPDAKPDEKDQPEPPHVKPRVKEPVLSIAPPPIEKPKARPKWTIQVLGPNGMQTMTFEKAPADNSADGVWKPVQAAGSSTDNRPPAERPSKGEQPPSDEEPSNSEPPPSAEQPSNPEQPPSAEQPAAKAESTQPAPKEAKSTAKNQ